MARYLDTIAVLFGVYGLYQLAIGCLAGALIFSLGGGLMAFGASTGESEAVIAGGLYAVIGAISFVFMLFQPILAFFAASGIRRRTHLGRILGFVVCALAVLNIPIGTLVGIFGFVVLLDSEAAAEFSDKGREEYFT